MLDGIGTRLVEWVARFNISQHFIIRILAHGDICTTDFCIKFTTSSYSNSRKNLVDPTAQLIQHDLGIMLIELGVGITVTAVVLIIYYGFVSRRHRAQSEDK